MEVGSQSSLQLLTIGPGIRKTFRMTGCAHEGRDDARITGHTRHRRRVSLRFVYLSTLPALLVLTSALVAQQPSRSAEITPVAGVSWLTHLQRPFDATSMGKTGYLGPAPFATGPQSPPALLLSVRSLDQTVSLGGADIYRFNCRGCHGEQGTGAPPEINSVINPVRATSAALFIERMKSSGLDISHAQANQMATQARAALTERLRNGGQSMPPFGYLKEAEARSLTGYLDQLADVPGAREYAAQESSLRVGEMIVKSTCHICHDATGANPTPEQLLQGAIPPLATLTSRTDELELVRKVTRGAPVSMGTPPMLQRGRMPVFYYITPDEAADVYHYLTLYPPRAGDGNLSPPPDERQLITLVTGSDRLPVSTRTLQEAFDGKTVLLVLTLGVVVILLIGAGLAITVGEFTRLSVQSAAGHVSLDHTHPKKMQLYSK